MLNLQKAGAWAALILLILASPLSAEPTERRIALVIGNGNYQAGALATPANDAGLVAQTLEAAGFDVAGARDLDADSLRHAFQDFVDKASAAGPDTVAFVYFAGYGLQLEGENYLVPVDAAIAHDTDVPARAVRLSDYTRSLAGLKLKAAMVVLDAARSNPFAAGGQPLASGLAMVEPDPGMLIAFNATPGTVAQEGQDGYGAYAKALAEMIREGGLTPIDLFDRLRLRVNEITKGGQVPWDASKIETQVIFLERAADAPPPPSPDEAAAVRSKPIRELGAEVAYEAALERDTIEAYGEFLDAYPRDPMAKRVRAIVAARREAITWRRTYRADTPDAYWSYLRRYPHGMHAFDARRRLARLAAALDPPARFVMLDYDVPPPPPDETVYIDRPVLAFYDPDFGFAPPPPPPVYVLGPPVAEFWDLPPPPPPAALFVLPIPMFVPVQAWVRPPAYVAPPPNNVIFANIHNTVVINSTSNEVVIKDRAGRVVTPQGPAAATAAVYRPALPPSVAHRATLIEQEGRTPGPETPAPMGQPGAAGVHGQPQITSKPPAAGPAPSGTQPPQGRQQELGLQHQQEMQKQQQLQQQQQIQRPQQQQQAIQHQEEMKRQQLQHQQQQQQQQLQHQQQQQAIQHQEEMKRQQQQQHQQQQQQQQQLQHQQQQQQAIQHQEEMKRQQLQHQQQQQPSTQQHQQQPQHQQVQQAHPPAKPAQPQKPHCGAPGLPPCPH